MWWRVVRLVPYLLSTEEKLRGRSNLLLASLRALSSRSCGLGEQSGPGQRSSGAAAGLQENTLQVSRKTTMYLLVSKVLRWVCE